jgi:hypothetical protein
MLVLGEMRAYSNGTPPSDLIGSLWITVVFGVGITLLLSIAHWLSPLKVDSGPSGIVRSKGNALALVPWKSIRSYRIYELEGERVLELSVTYATQPERFYLAENVDVQEVERELRTNVPADA